MAHPHPFIKVVAEGRLYDTEAFSFGFHIVQAPTIAEDQLTAVTQELADKIGNLVRTYFNSAAPDGLAITAKAKLDRVKVNRIGRDGRYMDTASLEHVVNPAIAGRSDVSPPPQLALAVSLIGNENPRGLAGRGRFYLPPMAGLSSVTDVGKISPQYISLVVSATQKLIRDVNALFNGLGVQYAYVGNTSSGSGNRPGRQQVVSEIRVGNVCDTVRSRRRSLQENYTVGTI